jgi:hypothetical protein
MQEGGGAGGRMKTAKEWVYDINTGDFDSPHSIGDKLDMSSVTEVTVIDRDSHRWYTLGTMVFKVGDEFFGVRGAVDMKSEEASWSDLGIKSEAFEMEQVPSVTYKRKPPTIYTEATMSGRFSGVDGSPI